MASTKVTQSFNIEQTVEDVLDTIERDREREIISRRFGLFDRKETLEQIGELLGITRERVRQLEKAVMIRLKAAAKQDLPHIKEVESLFGEKLREMGYVARLTDLTATLDRKNTRIDQARVSFLAQLCPKLAVIDENDFFFQAVGLSSQHDEKKIRDQVGKIIDAVKKIGEPTSIDKIAEAVGDKDSRHVQALASTSKQIATLNNRWGLIKWPMVNPKNIRDKIYVILHDYGKHMHFNEIAKAIKDSSFKRKDVTTQAIHNELIKDKRFVLIGRGIYALKEWGDEKGKEPILITVVLKNSKEPFNGEETVKR